VNKTTRRQFIQQYIVASSATVILPQKLTNEIVENDDLEEIKNSQNPFKLDLSPAKWIWFPSGRTLPNTFIFFKKLFNLSETPTKATGWILGESRYKLYLNTDRIQWGPAPSDPRWSEADPIDFTGKLKSGQNVIGVEVLFYGFGDGTWPIGKPGFIFKLDLAYQSGKTESIISDESWITQLANAWKPGQYKRWYLRSLQEEFDSRLYPKNWNTEANEGFWHNAQAIAGAKADTPVIASWSRDYLYDAGGGNISGAELRKRSIPMLNEEFVNVKQLSEQFWIKWEIPADTYFQYVTPEKESFEVIRENYAKTTVNQWIIEPKSDLAAVLTFEFEQQHVGFPYFTIEASEGTIIELLVHEGHEINSSATIMNSHFNSWSKFICKEGKNRFETFDYESLRWLQLHVRNAKGTIKISDVGMRRRVYPFANLPKFACSEPKLDKLFRACVNTIHNQSQETIVDGMARERQQYSGDLGHVLHALMRGFGETKIVARFLNTFSQGLTKAGYFLDTWPAYDRLARLMEREIGITEWGPIIDHGVGFNFDCFYYYQYSGDIEALREVYPRLKTFLKYLKSIQNVDGTMPVENIGIPAVWIDHNAYKKQKHKECAFSLYVAAMCKIATPVLARAFNDEKFAKEAEDFGVGVLNSTNKKYWDTSKGVFVCNKPWIAEENEVRYCDRSLAMAVLYELNLSKNHSNSIKILTEKPKELGLSYSANANWRYWALAKGKKMDVVLNEFKNEWYPAPSVQLNNTMAEFLDIKPDNNGQWSHASIAPFYSIYMDIAGVKPLKVGFEEIEIEPQMGDLEELIIEHHTIHGSIKIHYTMMKDNVLLASIDLPQKIKGKIMRNGKSQLLKQGFHDYSL
jgi:alpha-L-rhamnosidase